MLQEQKKSPHQLLREHLLSEFPFNKVDVESFIDHFRVFEAEKNEHLLNVGEVESKVYYVTTGALRTYYIRDNNEEATRFIGFEGVFINCLSSFLKQQSSAEFLQALERTRGLFITRDTLMNLVDTNKVANQLYTKRIEIAFDNNAWRLETLMTKKAKDRYLYILETNPEVVLRLSNKVLSSYLGITQESLSRIKANL